MILTAIQIIIFLGYLVFIIKKFGVPESISESWYLLERKNQGELFIFFCWAIGFTMFYQGDMLFILSGSGICFVGVATQFKMNYGASKIVHYAGAAVCIGCSLLGLWVEKDTGWPLVLFAATVILMKVIKLKNLIFWIEVAAFLSIVCGFLALLSP